MEYILIGDEPTKFYLIAAIVFLLLNCLGAFLICLLLPWQTKRLLKKWKITLRNTQKLPLLRQLSELVINLSGTVSYGVPVVTDIYPNGISSANLLALAAAIEKNISHPVAEAIVEEAAVRGLSLPEISASNAVPGKGAEALLNRQTLSVGSAAFLQEQNINIDAEIFTKADQLAYKGQIIVFVAIGKFCRGFITLQDKLKRSIPGDISFLQDMGIEATILTGSNRSTAKSYLKLSGIGKLKSELSNIEKAKEVLLMHTSGAVIGSAGRSSKFDGAAQSTSLRFALEYADEHVKKMADVLIHTNSLATIATAKGIAKAAYGHKKTGLLILGICNLLLLLCAGFFANLEAMPAYSATIVIVLGIISVALMLFSQIPLKY